MNKKSLYGSIIRAGMKGVQYTANVQLGERGRNLKDIFHFYFFTSKCSGGITKNIQQLLIVHLSNQTFNEDGLLKEDCFDYVFDEDGKALINDKTDFRELVDKSGLISMVMQNNNLPDELKNHPIIKAIHEGDNLSDIYNWQKNI